MRSIILLTISFTVFQTAFFAIGSSKEFRLDLSGMGMWERRTAAAEETLAYSSSWTTNASADAKSVVQIMPVLKPKYLVIDLSGGTNATHYPVSSLDEVPGGSWSDEYKTDKLVLRHIPAGAFIMGGRNTDYPGAVNTNLHMVTITRDFYMGVFEVTQRQWELVMGTRPSFFTNETCYATRPVEKVSYFDIRGSEKGAAWPDETDCDEESFLGVLSAKSGLSGIDLPTDAQWEYACRAGTSTSLQNGKNISSAQDEEACPELMTIARFVGNSNCKPASVPMKQASTDEECSARVGSYAPNSWGLYDMHGNVWEWCLDRTDWLAMGAVDPVGTRDNSVTNRMIRGGAFHELAWRCGSGFRYSDTRGVGYRPSNRVPTVGLRLCFQRGDVPDFDSASIEVDRAGTGTQVWTPKKAGTYYLTHSTMDGATNTQLLSAWFEVPGYKLSIEPQGELTNGVRVAIGGAGDGWKVYYTTNGLAPSAMSTEYTGPFVLSASAKVRAIAYSEQGVESEEVAETFTLHDALHLASAVARQRYPWNGMVDVDIDLKGDETAVYLVSLIAQDLAGGTNLAVRTVSGAGLLSPGTHRLTWHADADIPDDFNFGRVAVTVKATDSPFLKYAKTLKLTVSGYEGAETLANVPTLVRLSTAIEGFDYADFATTNGSDLVFFDENQVPLSYEIDEWRTNGESLVWVKLPELKPGTGFTAAWGRSAEVSSIDGGEQEAERAKHEVWRDYAAVWHMNEDSGTAYDSTKHHLDGIPSFGTNELADISQMVAYENGACGRARVNGRANGKGGNYLTVPASDAFALGGEFSVAGWFRLEKLVCLNDSTTDCDDPRLISLKPQSFNQMTGFEINFENRADYLAVRAQTNSYFYVNTPSALTNWVSLVAQYSQTNVSVYANGNLLTNAIVKRVIDDEGVMLGIGNNANGSLWSVNGQYDEIRLRGGTLSADRIKADYDMIMNRRFLTYGTVECGWEGTK